VQFQHREGQRKEHCVIPLSRAGADAPALCRRRVNSKITWQYIVQLSRENNLSILTMFEENNHGYQTVEANDSRSRD
jgi:hypothetical protein